MRLCITLLPKVAIAWTLNNRIRSVSTTTKLGSPAVNSVKAIFLRFGRPGSTETTHQAMETMRHWPNYFNKAIKYAQNPSMLSVRQSLECQPALLAKSSTTQLLKAVTASTLSSPMVSATMTIAWGSSAARSARFSAKLRHGLHGSTGITLVGSATMKRWWTWSKRVNQFVRSRWE